MSLRVDWRASCGAVGLMTKWLCVPLALALYYRETLMVILDAARVGLPLSEFEALSATAATFFNIGPAFGLAGPFENYAAFGLPTKLFMTFLM